MVYLSGTSASALVPQSRRSVTRTRSPSDGDGGGAPADLGPQRGCHTYVELCHTYAGGVSHGRFAPQNVGALVPAPHPADQKIGTCFFDQVQFYISTGVGFRRRLGVDFPGFSLTPLSQIENLRFTDLAAGRIIPPQSLSCRSPPGWPTSKVVVGQQKFWKVWLSLLPVWPCAWRWGRRP